MAQRRVWMCGSEGMDVKAGRVMREGEGGGGLLIRPWKRHGERGGGPVDESYNRPGDGEKMPKGGT